MQVFLAVDVGAALGVAAAAGVRSSMAPCLRVLSPDGEKVRAPCPTLAAATFRLADQLFRSPPALRPAIVWCGGDTLRFGWTG